MTLLLLTLACEPSVVADPDEAIEITGYLDSARTSVTSDEPFEEAAVTARVVGLSGASDQLGELTVSHEFSGDEVVVQVQEDGSFFAEILAANGDVLTLAQPGATPISLAAAPLAPFPDHTQTHIERPDDHTMAVTLDLPGDPLHTFVLSNPIQGLVVEMHQLAGTQSVAGEIDAEVGEHVLMHGVNGAGAATLAAVLTAE